MKPQSEPVADAQTLMRRPVTEVFEAFLERDVESDLVADHNRDAHVKAAAEPSPGSP